MITKIVLTLLVFGIVFYGLRFLKKINFNNNYEAKKDEKERLFCGLVTGYDARVEPLPKCWEQMTKHERSKYTKMKKTEYQTLILK